MLTAPELEDVLRDLRAGKDATLAVGQSGRPLVLASLWADDPRPCLLIVPGEEAADRTARALSAWLGMDHVARYPERRDWPWSDKPADDAVVGARSAAVARLAAGEACVVVASGRSLLRRVPPVGSGYYASSTFAVGDEIDFEDVPRLLVGMGYADTGEVDGAGTFHVHGDTVDVWPAQATSPVRIEFFGDEVDRVRRMVPSTGQTIGELSEVTVSPCRELALTDETIAHAKRALFRAAQDSTQVAADLELIEQHAAAPALDRYLEELYGSTASPIDHISSETLVVLAEPRALFDDCQRAWDDISAAANAARIKPDALFTNPRQMDFGKQQRLSFASMLRAGTAVTSELGVRQPGIAGSDSKLIGRVRQLVRDHCVVVFAVPDRGARESLKLHFTDEGIPLVESLGAAPENRQQDKVDKVEPLRRGMVTFTDLPVPAGIVVPSARLAVLSVSDLTARMAKSRRARRRVDPTTVTFPFKPGDYVVHATHGIALFSDIVRQEVGGRERDYFLLEYAGGDKLFVPLEQVDRISRYVGPDGSSPRLTRLNTADWSRATGKARKSAKKLAFDLVDLYTRRSSVQGWAFSPDTPAQADMEASFSYEVTPDQKNAIEDIKADMETPKPMDRLLCGDVGFGKTEVALRAAMKAVLDSKQAAILVPTTVLAQQHYATAVRRFAGFPVNVDVLSRFRTATEQKRTLAALRAGSVDLVIGTHKLLSKNVEFKDLGLLIVDEEQRFGVSHKERLKEISRGVDVLTLSATPIPRTLNMALSGLRDMSTLEEPPQDRYPVQTFVMEYSAPVIDDAIRRELARGGQVYYLHNHVESIDAVASGLMERIPEARFAVAHGRMNEDQLGDVMQRMADGQIDILVCTTIIETGIDIPNVNTLIVEYADRFGLSQLHQLRGRVGRSGRHAFAYFTFRQGKVLSELAEKRLNAIRDFAEFGSGFKIAMRDLEIRGAGNLLGAEQSGHMMSVGYDMYLKLLEDAVLEERGERKAGQTDCTADLSIPAGIDPQYVENGEQRMDLYRRMAAIRSQEDADELLDEIVDRYGDPPKGVMNLIAVALMRTIATGAGITDVSQKQRAVVFTLARFEPEAVSAVCALPELKGRIFLGASGDSPVLTVRLLNGEDPLALAKGFVARFAEFTEKLQSEPE